MKWLQEYLKEKYDWGEKLKMQTDKGIPLIWVKKWTEDFF